MRIAVLIEDRCKPNSNAYDYLKNSLDHFPVAKKYNNEILSLPLYPEIDKKSQDYVIENIIDFFKNINLIS